MAELLKDDEIQYVRCWVNCYKVDTTFTFKDWEKKHVDDENAPVGKKLGKQVVKALEADDSRLDFIAFGKGLGREGKIGCRTSGNVRYYKRLR